MSVIAADSTVNNRQCRKVRYAATTANRPDRAEQTGGVATDRAVGDRGNAGNTQAPAVNSGLVATNCAIADLDRAFAAGDDAATIAPKQIITNPCCVVTYSAVDDRERVCCAINAGTITAVFSAPRGVAGYSAVENGQHRATAVTVDEDSATDVSRVVIRQGTICYGRGYVLT